MKQKVCAMYKLKILFIFFFFSTSSIRAQLTKNNWLVGGNGSFSRSNNLIGAPNEYKSTAIVLSPNIGYFFVDKLATGLRVTTTFIKNNPSNTSVGVFSFGSRTEFFNLGPFVRYYFLNTEKRINFFTEGLYQYQLRRDININSESKESANVFIVSCGPVFYLNNIVGIEFTIGYSTQKYTNSLLRTNTIQTAIGLQIHLEKEK